MKKFTDIVAFFLRALTAGLALAFIAVYLWPALLGDTSNRGHAAPGETPATGSVPAEPFSYADAVNKAAPAVVSIYTSALDPQPVDTRTQSLLGQRMLYRMRRDMGSGVLVSEDGYILTNHHVISGAQHIKAGLWDGRIAGAQVVGSDPETDLAVLKINLDGLPTAPLGENPGVRVGDVVLAIGNALGLSHTVTMGIVSATDRTNIGSSSFDGFIQTDAAINAGNSGGALVNARGDLIGINTRFLGGNTGAQNIGFAIPAAVANHVMEQIIEYGSVRRGWLGVMFSKRPPLLRPDGLVQQGGVYVRDVTRAGPGWQAGLREGDEILSLNGQPYTDMHALSLAIASFAPETRVELEVRRGGETFQTYATLIQQPPMDDP